MRRNINSAAARRVVHRRRAGRGLTGRRWTGGGGGRRPCGRVGGRPRPPGRRARPPRPAAASPSAPSGSSTADRPRSPASYWASPATTGSTLVSQPQTRSSRPSPAMNRPQLRASRLRRRVLPRPTEPDLEALAALPSAAAPPAHGLLLAAVLDCAPDVEPEHDDDDHHRRGDDEDRDGEIRGDQHVRSLLSPPVLESLRGAAPAQRFGSHGRAKSTPCGRPGYASVWTIALPSRWSITATPAPGPSNAAKV